MGVFLLIVALVLFIITDLIIRTILKKAEEKKMRKLCQEALETNLQLDFSHESKTLKRVEVPNPKARILAVDDEEIILDSFRKILVLAGYSIDTVETGQEALALIQKRHYDFVFTDLKMPEMDGVEVCKAVKHLRPDIDVIIITGYATVESAVETMKYGAMDYVQKPFTEDELVAMVDKFLIQRQERIRKQLKSRVHITHVGEPEIKDTVEFYIPGGVFIAPWHTWAALTESGEAHIGVDDFANKLIGKIDAIDAPNPGMEVKQGQLLFSVRVGQKTISFRSPITGRVLKNNGAVIEYPDRLEITSYEGNWICQLDAEKLDEDIKNLKIGKEAVKFFEEELEKLQGYVKKSVKSTVDEKNIPADGKIYIGELRALNDKDFHVIVHDFFEKD
ncbi:histidine kinase [candidate division KSB1 bacterium 4484_87]|nr:MAG: histidine kinase [candidate division KSB1 bacterium 4484_87]